MPIGVTQGPLRATGICATRILRDALEGRIYQGQPFRCVTGHASSTPSTALLPRQLAELCLMSPPPPMPDLLCTSRPTVTQAGDPNGTRGSRCPYLDPGVSWDRGQPQESQVSTARGITVVNTEGK